MISFFDEHSETLSSVLRLILLVFGSVYLIANYKGGLFAGVYCFDGFHDDKLFITGFNFIVHSD